MGMGLGIDMLQDFCFGTVRYFGVRWLHFKEGYLGSTCQQTLAHVCHNGIQSVCRMLCGEGNSFTEG